MKPKPMTYEQAADWQKEILFDALRYCKVCKTEHPAREFPWTTYTNKNTGELVYTRRGPCLKAMRSSRVDRVIEEAYMIAAKYAYESTFRVK
jgi:hypothetical protein